MTCTHADCARDAVPHAPADRHPAGLCSLHADVWCMANPVPKPPTREEARVRTRPNQPRNQPVTLWGVPYPNAKDAAKKLKVSLTAVWKRVHREQAQAAAEPKPPEPDKPKRKRVWKRRKPSDRRPGRPSLPVYHEGKPYPSVTALAKLLDVRPATLWQRRKRAGAMAAAAMAAAMVDQLACATTG